MKKKRILALIIALTMIISSWTMGYSVSHVFSDMPEDWSTKALQNAVDNGLLNGSDGKIMPTDNLTRAQMAAVINRAFGAQSKADIQGFTDVPTGAWYYDEMAKAVQMKTFQGSGNKLDPTSAITREQAFIVMARALKLEKTDEEPSGFSDLGDISSWARQEVFSMIEAGYIKGSNGKIYPKATITRAEFAQLMDNLIKQYITEAGEYTEVLEGNIMINVPDVVLKGVKVTGDLIIGDGVGDGDVTLDSVEVTGRLLVRGGGEDTIIIKGDSNIQKIVIARVDGVVRVYNQTGQEIGEVIVDGSDDVVLVGFFGHVELLADNVDVYALLATLSGSNILGENSQIILPEVDDRVSIRSVSIVGDTDLPFSTISAIVSPSDATVQYKWLISDTLNGEYVILEGETSATLEIIPDDIGKFIKVEARGTGDYRRIRTSDPVVIGFGGFDLAKDAYEIANWYHLDNVRHILDGNFIMTANLGAPEDLGPTGAPSVFYETKGYDEVVGNMGFEPIGQVTMGSRSVTAFSEEEEDFLSQLFTGTFDGGNYAIKDLYIDRQMEYRTSQVMDLSQAAGLFGVIYQAELKNLTLQNSAVYGTHFVGGLAGYSRESILTNVHNLEYYNNDDPMPLGREPANFVVGYTRVGGITGINDSGTISFASNDGVVVGEEFAGGIAGSNHLDNIQTSPSVMSIEEPISYETHITDSWNGGWIVGSRYIGGIAGSNGTSFLGLNSTDISNLVYDEVVPASIARCNNDGFVESYDLMYNGMLPASMGLGGIVGLNLATVSECYNAGVVGHSVSLALSLKDVVRTTAIYNASEIGGIVGTDYYGLIENCYNNGIINGEIAVGGVVGYAFESTVKDTYNVGTVERELLYDRTLGIYYEQTIYGDQTDAYFEGNFYVENVQLRDLSEAKISDYGVYGRTIKELRNPLTYQPVLERKALIEIQPWDFDDIWFMDLSTNDGLPILRWEDVEIADEVSMQVTMPAFTLVYGQDASQAIIVSDGVVEVYGQTLEGEFTLDDNLEWYGPGYNEIRTSFSVPGDDAYLTFQGYAEVLISKADLTVTAENKSKTYDGNPFNAFTVDYDGFVYGDGFDYLYGTLGFTGSAINAIDAGTYTITPYGLDSYYYDITFADGTLTINKANPSVTWPETIYALRNEMITEDHFTGESSTQIGTFSITDDTTSWSDAGTYGLEVTFTPDDANYQTVSTDINVVVEELIFESIDVNRATGEIDLMFNLPVYADTNLELEDLLVQITVGEEVTEIDIEEILQPTGASDYFTIRCIASSLEIESLITVTIKSSGAAKLVDAVSNLLNTEILTRLYGIVYEEDFEDSDGGFTHTGTFDEWEWGTPITWPSAAASGLKCWGTDLDGDYEDNANMTLLSPIINLTYLPDGMPVNIQWMQAWHLESSWYDPVSVQYTIDGGSTWTDIWVHSGSTTQAPWQRLSQDISAAAGKNIQIRWLFSTDFSIVYSGIYIDDIIIEAGNFEFTGTEIVYPVSGMETEKEAQFE